MSNPRRLFKIALWGLCSVTLSGCWLRTPSIKPVEAVPASFVEADPATFNAKTPPASSVWHAFNDPVLDQLITTALAHNKTLEQTLAQVNEARALRGLEFYTLIPTVTASASKSRSKPSSRDPFMPPGLGTTTTFKGGFDASWEIDLFGGSYSAWRAARAQLAATEANLEAARQSVIAEVAQAYFSLRAEQTRLRVQQRNLANLEENQKLLTARLDAGRGTELDIARARALLLSTAARVPQTEAAVVHNEQRLSVLTAQSIDKLRTQLGAATPLPALPALVTVGTPADWLRRRPDIRAAQNQLTAAAARVGVDAADFFPQLTLLGGFGWTGQSRGDLGRQDAERWNFGPSLSWSFLDIGRVRQRVLASKARAAGAVAAYEDTVLRALEETENAFAAYRTSNRAATLLNDAVVTSRQATSLAQQRFDAGAADTLTVLDAERTLLDLEDQLATAESRRATSLAAVYKALAGDFAAGH